MFAVMQPDLSLGQIKQFCVASRTAKHVVALVLSCVGCSHPASGVTQASWWWCRRCLVLLAGTLPMDTFRTTQSP